MSNLAFLTSLPNFLETQCASFCWFLSTGLLDSLMLLQSTVSMSKFFTVKVFSENFFFIYSKDKYSLPESSTNTLTIKLFVPLNLGTTTAFRRNPVKLRRTPLLFLADIPLMTNRGTFILNGYEKICITQVLRSPGFYVSSSPKDSGVTKHKGVLIPERGAWLIFELVNFNCLTFALNKGEKVDLISFFTLFGLKSFEIFYGLQLNPDSYKLYTGKFSKKTKKSLIPFKRIFNTTILNEEFYQLGHRGRLALIQSFGFFNKSLKTTVLTLSDLFHLVAYFLHVSLSNDFTKDMDHLQTKYVRSIGEILQFQVFVGIKKVQREFNKNFLNCTTFTDLENLLQSNTLNLILQTFFSSSQLIQFLDQTNLISEISHQRRLGHVIVGNLSDSSECTDRAIHSSYFGRICCIETTEGNRAGLTSALAAYTRINQLGLFETPFFIVFKGKILYDVPVIYLTSYEEQFFLIAPADTPLTQSNQISLSHLFISFQNRSIKVPVSIIQLISVSSLQFFSLSVASIPFIEHDDANRVLMGANMQRQTIPLLYAHKPIVGTGIEPYIASTLALKSYVTGLIRVVSSNSILVQSFTFRFIQYVLKKFKRSNQNTCINQRASVWPGEFVTSGQILADSSEIENGEIALGQNILLAYMIWNGFNFEDSILINERLIFSDLFTSITILRFIENIPYKTDYVEVLWNFRNNTFNSSFKHLDSNGLIKKGTFVTPFAVLIGKVTLLPVNFNLNYLTLYNFNKKKMQLGQDTSIRATETCYGRVLSCIFLSHENTITLCSTIRFKIIILVAQLRKLQVGDKLSGRHGNKGILAKILAPEDMPYLPNGQSIDIILNPLGVPSRMNVGQLFEGLLGFAGNFLQKRFKIRPFNNGITSNTSRILITKYLKKAQQVNKFFWLYNQSTPGKLVLRDGKTGNCFDNSILVCKSYFLKLNHFVADKIQARSSGGYSLVSQQPLHGKSFKGGQRFGEMEVWALQAFGAAYTLQELLTLKSDNLVGREDVLDAILQNRSFVNVEVPESLNVLLFELKALGLNLEFYKIESLS